MQYIHCFCTGLLKGLHDRKCSPDGCWYCKDLCHNCFKPASVGYTKTVASVAYKHCSERCRALHFDNISEAPYQADPMHLNAPLIDTCLLRVTRVVSVDSSANAILSIHLCISNSHPKIPSNTPYVIQMCTAIESKFLSFFVSPDMSPMGHLWYCTPSEGVDAIHTLLFCLLCQRTIFQTWHHLVITLHDFLCKLNLRDHTFTCSLCLYMILSSDLSVLFYC